MSCSTCARISELLAASKGGSTHYAVEPEVSEVEVHFAKRNDAGELGMILSRLHPVGEDGCYIFNRPLPTNPTDGTEPGDARLELAYDAFLAGFARALGCDAVCDIGDLGEYYEAHIRAEEYTQAITAIQGEAS